MRIHLIRHGQAYASSDYNANLGYPDPGLDDIGTIQARLVGERLEALKIEAIYSSDLKRAGETAQIISRSLDTDIIFKTQLREINMGEIFTLGWGAFPEYHLEWKKHESDLPYPQGEAGADVKNRAWPVLEEIIEQYQHDVAVVSHGGVIMVLLSACLNMAMENRFRFAPPANCGISTLYFNQTDHSLKVEKFNDTTHLNRHIQE